MDVVNTGNIPPREYALRGQQIQQQFPGLFAQLQGHPEMFEPQNIRQTRSVFTEYMSEGDNARQRWAAWKENQNSRIRFPQEVESALDSSVSARS